MQKELKTNKFLPKLDEKLFLNSEDGFLVEYFDKEIKDDKPIDPEVLKGTNFWIFEGFAKDIINRNDRPSVIVRFSIIIHLMFLKTASSKFLELAQVK